MSTNKAIPTHARRYARGYEKFEGFAAELSSQSKPSWPKQPQLPPNSPNVIVMLMDDMGFSDISPFGSEISTPNLQSVADQGYSFTDYRTCPLCSPSRASLLTGLNPHRAGFATVAVNADPGYPGYALEIAADTPTVAESFQAAGYATFMVGKWHLTKSTLLHDGADKSSWPVQRGFDHYFGSMDGFTNLFQPHRLMSDNTPVEVDQYPDDYYLTDVLTDHALRYIADLRANSPTKPFFMYFAHNAVHAPIQAKEADIQKYERLYLKGWDRARQERFQRQMDAKLFPDACPSAPYNEMADPAPIPWEDLTSEQKMLSARYMAVYAAAIDNVDQNFGRLARYLKKINEYDNTIIVFASDNGAAGDGGPLGTRSYFSSAVDRRSLPARWQTDVPRDPALVGGPRALVQYPQGWAQVSNTPFRLYKGATFEGGVRAPLLVSWPRGLPRKEDDSGLRNQFTYVSDVGLTLLDLAGVPHLSHRKGVASPEVDGISFVPVLRDRDCKPLRIDQYLENNGNRAMYHKQWKIVTAHQPNRPFNDDEWQLYDLGTDPFESTDISERYPELVAQLGKGWTRAAWRNTVFPLADDDRIRRVRPSSELVLESAITLYPDSSTLDRYRSYKLVHLRDFRVECSFVCTSPAQGVLFAHGDQGGGYVATLEDGIVTLCYNEYGTIHRISSPLNPNKTRHRLSFQFTCGPELDWRVELSVADGDSAVLESVLQLIGLAPLTGISVGVDRGSPVDWDVYQRHGCFRFTGEELEVRYVPGRRADYNQEIIVLDSQMASQADD